MKMRLQSVFGMGAILSAVLLPVKLSLSAITQGEDDGQPKIERHNVTEKHLINPARGRDPESAVPAACLQATRRDACATRRANPLDEHGPPDPQ